jgi:hypothetical protein
MKFSSIALAAVATLALSSGAAFADTTSKKVVRAAPAVMMPVAMERTVSRATTIFGTPASMPTIFGHAVSRSVYVIDGGGQAD